MSDRQFSRRTCGHRRPAQCRQIDPGECAGRPQGDHRDRQAADHAASDSWAWSIVPRRNWSWSIRRACTRSTRRVMNQYMNRVAISSSQDADVILFVIEAMRFTEEDVWVWERVRGLKQPLFLVVNKVDRVVSQGSAAALPGRDDRARPGLGNHPDFGAAVGQSRSVGRSGRLAPAGRPRRCSPRTCSPTGTSRFTPPKSCARS